MLAAVPGCAFRARTKPQAYYASINCVSRSDILVSKIFLEYYLCLRTSISLLRKMAYMLNHLSPPSIFSHPPLDKKSRETAEWEACSFQLVWNLHLLLLKVVKQILGSIFSHHPKLPPRRQRTGVKEKNSPCKSIHCHFPRER